MVLLLLGLGRRSTAFRTLIGQLRRMIGFSSWGRPAPLGCHWRHRSWQLICI